MQFMWFIL